MLLEVYVLATFINTDFRAMYFTEELGRSGYSLPDLSVNKENSNSKLTSG